MSSSPPALAVCEQCQKTFSKKANLVRHFQNIHGAKKSEQLVLCPLCHVAINKKLFDSHCEEDHDLIINHQHLSFTNSKGEFYILRVSQFEENFT